MHEISITELQNLKIGQAENAQAGTGCTVFLLGENGAPVGLDVRGGGPASRESELLKPTAAAQVIHAILLGGGSAFGLDAAGGVMRYLEEHDIGFDVGVTKVPLVCQSDLFDLTVGDAHTRPDAAMAYQACVNAETGNYRDGNYGAGTGATVGKLRGMAHCTNSGIGSWSEETPNGIRVAALIAVNAIGDVYENGSIIAGTRADDGSFTSTEEGFLQMASNFSISGKNTTIGVVATNVKLTKAQATKVAGMAHDGLARCIRPIHTSLDGDTIFSLSTGELEFPENPVDTVGILAARVAEQAIIRAVKAAK